MYGESGKEFFFQEGTRRFLIESEEIAFDYEDEEDDE